MSAATVARLAGLLLVLLGSAVMLGWALQLAPLVRVLPDYPPMVFNTALSFVLAGSALLAPLVDARRFRWASSALGGLIALIACLVLAQHLLTIDLGIDWPALHAWARVPGRMVVGTACGFLLGGVVLMVANHAEARNARMLLPLLAVAPGIIGLLGIAGYLVHAHLLFPGYFLAGMAVHTAVGHLVFAIGLWAAGKQQAWGRLPQFRDEVDRISLTAATILALLAFGAGIATFAMLQARVQTQVGDSVLAALARRAETFNDVLEAQRVNARVAATRPAVIGNLRIIQAGQDDGANLANIRAVVETFIKLGFSALAYQDLAGKAVAEGGVFVRAPALAVTLGGTDAAELLWDQGFVLRQRISVRDAGGQVGTVLTEQPLAILTRMAARPARLGPSEETGICVMRAAALHCFPQRLNPTPYSTPLVNIDGAPLPMTRAVRGETGVLITRDYRQQNVIAAFGPVGDTGLGMVVKVDTAEIFRSIREQMLLAAGVLLLLTIGGTWLLRARIKPLAAEIMAGAAKLRDNRERFQTVVAGVKDYAVIELDPGGHIVSWNAGAQRIKGYAAEEIIGRHFSIFYPEEAIAQGIPAMELRILAAEGRFEDEGWRLRKDGSRFWASVVITALFDESGVLRGHLKFTRDISERRRLEQSLLEKNLELESAAAAKDRFFAGMSHELRTPLNAIIGFTGTLLMKLPGPLNAVQEKQLRLVQAGGRHLLSLINDLLDLARLDAGHPDLRPQAIDCRALLEELAATMRPQAEQKGLALALDLPPEAVTLHADRRALTQIMINLLGNAIKFTEHGAIGLRLEQRPAIDGRRVAISVADSGQGIAPADQARIFEAYSRGAAAERRKQEGTGLGLHLSHKLARAMGGSLEFRSEVGAGSCFTLELPER